MQPTRVLRRTVLAAALAGIAATTTAAPALADAPAGSLSGVVRDTRGALVADATISVYLDPSSGPVQELRSDARGRFRATGLKAGGYQIQIGLSGWSEWAPGRIADPGQAKSYQVTAEHNTRANSVITAAGVITGRLLGPDGRPTANTDVQATNVNTAAQHAGRTAADGTYRLRVQPNQTFIVSYSVGRAVEYVPHTFNSAEATRYFVRSAQTIRVDDRAIDLAGISGQVTDAAGAPTAGVRVQAVNIDTANEAETSTRADGTYDLTGQLVPGQYKVRFTAGDRSQYAHQKLDYDSADTITVTSGSTVVVDDRLLWVPQQRDN